MDNQFVLKEFMAMAVPTVALLLPITMALVTYWGKLGITGKWQFVSSMLTGLILGGVVMYAQMFPSSFIEWLQVALVGLIEGLAASGVYEVGRELVSKN